MSFGPGNQLTTEQQQISGQLQSLLRSRIVEHGPIPFSHYMHACLYEPGLGYYVNGMSKFGAHGDFVTAPELSGRFAACLARQAAEVLQGDTLQEILEFGAGTGRLACDVLKSLDTLESLPDRYLILDVSGQLMAEQQQLLAGELPPSLMDRVCWIQSVDWNGTANEPRDVELADGHFVAIAKADETVRKTVGKLQSGLSQSFADGFTSEYCASLNPWWRSMAEIMQKGLILICDYGCDQASYYSSTKNNGTLRCFFRHGVHNDPLVYSGVQDLTADVDFTALTQAAVDAGFDLEGYTPMSQFMLGNDVLKDHQRSIAGLSEQAQIDATGNLKQLLLPQEMGERFMVAGYSVGIQHSLRGFSLADWSHTL